MSYMKDPDRMVRGVGAIAAADAGSRKRLRARIARTRAMNQIDARHARLAHGPGRALPVPLGAISKAGAGLMSSGRGPTISSGGGGIEVPVWKGGTPTPTFEKPPPFPTTPPPLPPPRKAITSYQPSSMVSSMMVTGLPGSSVTPGSGMTPYPPDGLISEPTRPPTPPARRIRRRQRWLEGRRELGRRRRRWHLDDAARAGDPRVRAAAGGGPAAADQ